MAQPSVASYFNTRKRPAIEDLKLNRAKKVLLLGTDSETGMKDKPVISEIGGEEPVISSKPAEVSQDKEASIGPNKIVNFNANNAPVRKVIRAVKPKKVDANQQDIQQLLGNISKPATCPAPSETKSESSKALEQTKTKLLRSARLAELKASLSRFNKLSDKLKEDEERTALVSQRPKLKDFKSVEIEVPVSPQKVQSPEKAYLSPKKETSQVRRNLLNCLSPTKNAVALPESPSKKILESASKPALKLPFKYRYFAEMFGAIDVVAQIMFNRKETITFKKLKPAVEKMVKRNLTEKHLAQIKKVYPEAYQYTQEKLRVFGTGSRQEEWELVLTPTISGEKMTEQALLERKRKLFNTLLDTVKDYHDEFLKGLTPPIVIPKDEVRRWHPKFDYEKVPDIEQSDVPQPPVQEKLTGKQVLERARQLFNCNTRMEQALARLQAAREANPSPPQDTSSQPESILKGIPKALLEKVRQRQAAKALASMTRSADKEKEVQLYSKLPEIARLTRGLFVAEKKQVLPLDTVVEKLGNSYRGFLNKVDMETHLRTISQEVPGWLVFHNIRNSVYLKLAKNDDLSLVLSKLESLAKEKSEATS